jgi:hypothetical protein
MHGSLHAPVLGRDGILPLWLHDGLADRWRRARGDLAALWRYHSRSSSFVFGMRIVIRLEPNYGLPMLDVLGAIDMTESRQPGQQKGPPRSKSFCHRGSLEHLPAPESARRSNGGIWRNVGQPTALRDTAAAARDTRRPWRGTTTISQWLSPPLARTAASARNAEPKNCAVSGLLFICMAQVRRGGAWRRKLRHTRASRRSSISGSAPSGERRKSARLESFSACALSEARRLSRRERRREPLRLRTTRQERRSPRPTVGTSENPSQRGAQGSRPAATWRAWWKVRITASKETRTHRSPCWRSCSLSSWPMASGSGAAGA